MEGTEGLRKIEFYFDQFAQEAFHTLEDSESSDNIRLLTSANNVVSEANVIARVIDFDDPDFNNNANNIEELNSDPSSLESDYVYYNSKTKEYVSKLYGFASYKDHKLQILPLTWVTDDKLEAYIYVHPTISKTYPSLTEIKKHFDLLKLIHVQEDYHMNMELDKIKNDPNSSGGGVLIAEGAKPKDGVVEMVELKKVLEQTVGKELEDGRIDYKEKNFFYTVARDEAIAETIPEVPPTDGVDVFGQPVKGKLTGVSPYKLGRNLKPEYDGSHIYRSAIDGVLDISEKGQLNIEERLVVTGDVNLNTGNIHFPGIVEITGNIQPGFKVQADKSVIVNGNIEDSEIIAGDKVIVGNGILGKEHCKVRATGSVEARFIQNADVFSERDIAIVESAVQARCFAKEHIKVIGRVVGGELVGRFGIEVGIAGAASETKTSLVAGRYPELEKKVEDLTIQITELLNKLKDTIDEITQYFGENILHEIKQVIGTLPAHRQKQLLSLIQSIKDTNGQVQKLKEEKETVKASLEFPDPPYIKVNEELFPGVTIRVKNSVKKIDEKFDMRVTFKEDHKTKNLVWD
ncbi:MAG: FapA family protein [Spirochaetota bacterium]|nr:FapA family protein [Spirochaetota bacterium]